MPRRKENIAIVGAGKGGLYVLQMLLKHPRVNILHVYDKDPEAPGMVFAREKGIVCSTNTTYPELWDNRDIDTILEVTGSETVFRALGGIKARRTALIGARGNRLFFAMLADEARMRERLEEYQDALEKLVALRTAELQQANEQLESKVEELAVTNRQLEELNQAKTRYLLRSTHHLKAPFAAIQSYTDLILKGYTGEIPEQTSDIVAKIKLRCEVLSTTIREMLQLANLQTIDRNEVRMDTAELNQLVGDVVEQTGIIAAGKNVHLTFESGPEPANIHCDPGQTARLFEILIKNAIDYSHQGSEVTVSVKTDGKQATVAVKDRGIGISPQAKKKIFDEFYRSNEAADKHPDGSGVGLAIAAHIARLHDFRIRVRSTVGRGSTFSVIIPMAGVS